jgi:glycosyltransferase involved in cell wall biosynthesis
MLQICCAIYKSTSGNGQVTLITDCHNKALKRNLGGPAGYLYRRFKSWSLGCADLLIVSNELIVPIAECYNRRVTALRDPLPEWSAAATSVVEPDMFARATKPTCFTETLPAAYVLFICSFDADEPLELIFDSAKAIVDALSCSVYITGDKRRVTVPGTIESDTKIVFPGYLPLAEYVSMLRSAMVVVVLTEDSDCLVCGGYEGIAAGRPTVLSDTPALHACFGETALYSRHSVDEILQAVIAAAVECRSWETASALQVLQSAIDREWKCLLKAIDELMKRHG